MMGSIEFISNNAFRKIFSFYGFTSTSFILFSGIVVSGLGLSDLINPTIWLFSSGAALIFGYSIRHYISNKFLGILLFSIMLIILQIYINIVLTRHPNYIPSEISTSYLAGTAREIGNSFILSLSFVISYISYKNSEVIRIEDMPNDMSQSLYSWLANDSMYYEEFTCNTFIEYEPIKGVIRIDSDIKMVVRNRSSSVSVFTHKYPKVTNSFRLHSVHTDGKIRDISSPRLHSEDGVRLLDEISPKGTLIVKSKMTEFFYGSGAELYVCYNHASKKYTLSITNHTPNEITAWIEPLSLQEHETATNGEQITWQSKGAIFAYQGARIVWKKA